MSLFDKIMFRETEEVVLTVTEMESVLVSVGEYIDWYGTPDQIERAIEIFTDMAAAGNANDAEAWAAEFQRLNNLCMEFIHAGEDELLASVAPMFEGLQAKVVDPTNN